MHTLIQDLRYSVRALTRNPGFTLVAVLALGLGIGACASIFSVVEAFLLRPLPYADAGRLVTVQSRGRAGNDLGVNYLDFLDWRAQSRTLADLAFYNLRWNGNLTLSDGTTATLKTTFTTWNLFSLLGVRPVVGRDLRAEDDQPDAPPVMLISHALWEREFGANPAMLGMPLALDGSSRTVVGVLPPGFRFPSQSDLWVPMGARFARTQNRGLRIDQAIARLSPGVSLEQARTEMAAVAGRLTQQYPATNREVTCALTPLREQTVGGDMRGSLWLLAAACGCLLLVACANVGNLLLARGVAREREMAVRSVLGASTGRLVRQLLTESVPLALLGGVAGVGLALWGVDGLAASIPVELPFWVKIHLDWTTLGFALALSLGTGLAAGLLPAWRLARDSWGGTTLTLALKEGGTTATGSQRLRHADRVFVVAEISATLVLLVVAGLLWKSFLRLQEVAPGFDARGVLMFTLNPTYRSDESERQRIERYQRVAQRLAELPGVEAAGVNNDPPFAGQRPWNRDGFTVEGQAPDAQKLNPLANLQTVNADYFRALRIPLLRGRYFDAHDDLDAPRVVMVSERLARRFWPGKDAVGQRLRIGQPEDKSEDWRTVIGVVGDVRHHSLHGEAGIDIYVPSLQAAWKQMHFLVRTRAAGLASVIRHEVHLAAPDAGVFDVIPMEQLVADSLWQPRLRGWLTGCVSTAALLLVVVGLYGVMAQAVARRRREFGIRQALGAAPEAIRRLVLGEGLRLTLFGLGLGTPAAVLAGRLLAVFLFDVHPVDPAIFTGLSLTLGAVTMLASYLPARRAMQVAPAVALREE